MNASINSTFKVYQMNLAHFTISVIKTNSHDYLGCFFHERLNGHNLELCESVEPCQILHYKNLHSQYSILPTMVQGCFRPKDYISFPLKRYQKSKTKSSNNSQPGRGGLRRSLTTSNSFCKPIFIKKKKICWIYISYVVSFVVILITITIIFTRFFKLLKQ